jgi:mannose/fructose/N-acetylgalactosamine-specific phosphotransferase system component IIB
MANPSVIIRIDDRLIHGQILVGWCAHYPIKKIVVCDNQIAKNEWERELILMSVPSGIKVDIFTIKETHEFLEKNHNEKGTVMLLVSSAQQIQELIETGISVKKINVGGIHYREGRIQYLLYLFLDTEEVKIFRNLIEKGYQFTCQDLPTNSKYDLKKILYGKK